MRWTPTWPRAWNPATLTFNTLPQIYPAGSWWVPAPTAAGAQAWDVTTIVKNWVAGTWVSRPAGPIDFAPALHVEVQQAEA